MLRVSAIMMVAVLGCRAAGRPVASVPPATADQTMHDAVVIVCDTPARADADADRSMSRSDAVAKHLTDGIGNTRVVTTVEGWKTNGIDRAELEHLMKDAQLTTCRLRDEIRPR